MKQILTVCGTIEPAKLGYTLTHEHFSLDFDHFYVAPPEPLTTFLDKPSIHIENVGFVRQYPYGSRYNIHFNDDATHNAVLDDLKLFKQFGGSSIVENTSNGLARNLELCYRASKECDLNIVAGTGHYVYGVQSPEVLKMSVEEMAQLYETEIMDGHKIANGSTVRCGFIGEVGSGWPIHEFEKNSIRATAEVQSKLGCGVSFHPGRDPNAPFEIVRTYLEAGGRADKCVMSHLDRTVFNDDQLLEFSDFGTFCQFDLFGTECSYYQLNPETDMPSDGQRIDRLVKLINAGVDRILLSHDIHTKHRLINFGGHGYSHILNNVLPRFLLRGVSGDMVHKITVQNPRDWLEFECK